MKLIIGLGNPGFRHRHTRHNIGFMVMDRIASDFKIRLRERLFHSLCGKGRVDGEEVILAKPLTYMNLSGKAVAAICDKEGILPEGLFVISDDIDLSFGKIRLRAKGSSGGHKGLRSIIEELKTEEFPRLRVGIGPNVREGFLSDYVLRPFNRNERKSIGELTERCRLCAEAWLKEGIEAAMNRFNP